MSLKSNLTLTNILIIYSVEYTSNKLLIY